jgi:hypothetical protein
MNDFEERKREKLLFCDLSVRTYNTLVANKIEYLDELVCLSAYDLLQFRALGKKSLNEIRDFLFKKNLALHGETINKDITKLVLYEIPERLNLIQNQVKGSINQLRHLLDKLDLISKSITNLQKDDRYRI